MKMKGGELPFSLIASEILLSRVPAKSDIGRCRCVCKEWKSFLSTPMFNRMHLQRHVTIKDYKLLLFDGQPPFPGFRRFSLNETIPNPNPNPNRNPKPVLSVVASLDGLVCIASNELPAALVIWNPLTGAYKRLPPKACAHDPISFYIDSSSNDYKLLCLHGGGRLGAHVYSHRSNSWREIEYSVFRFTGICSVWSPATFYGQCLYFTVRPLTDSVQINFINYWIICFDVKTETFRKIRDPPRPADGLIYYSASLVVLNGLLHLCVSYKLSIIIGDVMLGGDLWRIDGDEWVKVAAFTDQQQQHHRICTLSTASDCDWLAVLDQDDNSFKKVNMEDFITHYHYFRPASWEYRSSRIIYVESLVSPIL